MPKIIFRPYPTPPPIVPPTPVVDFLTFTAQEDNSTIALNKQGEGADVSLEYSVDNGLTWLPYTIGNTITLPFVGDSVKFRGNNQTFTTTEANFSFAMSGLIAASGNIMTLLTLDEKIDVPDYAFSTLFMNCTSLTQAPKLPATTLTQYCYAGMFLGCTSLTQAPALPATTLAVNCYMQMFAQCTALTQAPALPATTLAEGCYTGMFYGCTSLTEAPTLPATTLAVDCYKEMFVQCTSLTQAPALPATTLAEGCYNSMFKDCTSLTEAPALPATTLANNCYNNMFNGSTSLSYVEALFTTTPGSSYTDNWLSNVSPTGTFVKSANATWNVSGQSGIPNGWTITTK